MSLEATNWAWTQPVPHSGAKFVLLAMANRANPDHKGRVVAFTSIRYLADVTAQDRKTVVANLAKLRDWKLIVDTGDRVGKTKQVPVYELSCPPDLFSEYAQKRNSSKNGTVPNFPAKGPVFPSKESQKRDTDSLQDSFQDSGERHTARGAPDPDVAPTEAGRACLLMRTAGCSQTNPSHPDLLAALSEGVAPEVLRDTAAEAIEAGIGKPFAWAITTARNRHARGATAVASTSSASGVPNETPRRLSAVERVQANIERARRDRGEPIEGEAVRVSG